MKSISMLHTINNNIESPFMSYRIHMCVYMEYLHANVSKGNLRYIGPTREQKYLKAQLMSSKRNNLCALA